MRKEKKNEKSWMQYHPDELKNDFIACALFIAIFESLKEYVVEEVKYFFVTGFNRDGVIISERYSSEVLGRNKSPLYASLDFLSDVGAIAKDDIELFDRLKAYRNKLSHEMMKLIFENDLDEYPENLKAMMEMRRNIEKWWIVNIEIPTNPDFDGLEIDEDLIVTSSEMIDKMLLDILAGDKETSEQYYNTFKEYFEKENGRNNI